MKSAPGDAPATPCTSDGVVPLERCSTMAPESGEWAPGGPLVPSLSTAESTAASAMPQKCSRGADGCGWCGQCGWPMEVVAPASHGCLHAHLWLQGHARVVHAWQRGSILPRGNNGLVRSSSARIISSDTAHCSAVAGSALQPAKRPTYLHLRQHAHVASLAACMHGDPAYLGARCSCNLHTEAAAETSPGAQCKQGNTSHTGSASIWCHQFEV